MRRCGRASDDFVLDDRGKRSLVKGDFETWLSTLRYIVALPGFVSQNTDLATLGDRVALEHMAWTGAPEAGAFEIDKLGIVETDAEGLIRAVVLFDVDDRAAAFQEAFERFVFGEGEVAANLGPLLEYSRAFAARD